MVEVIIIIIIITRFLRLAALRLLKKSLPIEHHVRYDDQQKTRAIEFPIKDGGAQPARENSKVPGVVAAVFVVVVAVVVIVVLVVVVVVIIVVVVIVVVIVINEKAMMSIISIL